MTVKITPEGLISYPTKEQSELTRSIMGDQKNGVRFREHPKD